MSAAVNKKIKVCFFKGPENKLELKDCSFTLDTNAQYLFTLLKPLYSSWKRNFLKKAFRFRENIAHLWTQIYHAAPIFT